MKDEVLTPEFQYILLLDQPIEIVITAPKKQPNEMLDP